MVASHNSSPYLLGGSLTVPLCGGIRSRSEFCICLPTQTFPLLRVGSVVMTLTLSLLINNRGKLWHTGQLEVSRTVSIGERRKPCVV